jgi:hypothetical protein
VSHTDANGGASSLAIAGAFPLKCSGRRTDEGPDLDRIEIKLIPPRVRRLREALGAAEIREPPPRHGEARAEFRATVLDEDPPGVDRVDPEMAPVTKEGDQVTMS